MMRRRRAVCAKSKPNPWRYFAANLWALKEPIMLAAIYRIGSAVAVLLTPKRYPKRAPKKSSAPPIKSSAPDARNSNQPQHESLPALSPASRVHLYAADVPFLVRATAPQAWLLF